MVTPERSDRTPVLRLLAGAYGGLLCGPAAAGLGSSLGLATAWMLLVAGSLPGGGVGYLAGGYGDLRRWFSSLWVVVPLTVLPLCFLVWLVALAAHNPGMTPRNLLARPSTLGVFAVVQGTAAAHIATRQEAAARVDAAHTVRSFTARPPSHIRRRRYVAFAAALGSAVGLFVAVTVHAGLSVPLVVALAVAGPLSVVVLDVDERSVIVTETGVAIDGSFVEWGPDPSIEVSDDAVVVRPDSRLLGAFAFDRRDVPQPEGIRDVFDRQAADGS